MQPGLNGGVDVAKDTVVVACAEQHFPGHEIRNQRTALRTWLKSLPAGSRLGLESTKTYHEVLADLAHAHGPTVFLLNPMETRHYAKAMGARAKTDRVDATLLARLVAQEYQCLRPYTPPTATQRQLDRLIRRRAKLVRIKGMLKLTMNNLSGFASDVKAVLQKLDALLARLDATMATLAARAPGHRDAQPRIETIVGVGPLVGLSLTNTLERVPFRNADAFVAFIASTRGPRTRGRKAGAAAYPNAAQPRSAGCSSMLPWPRSEPKSGNPSPPPIAAKAGVARRRESLSRAKSPEPRGPFIAIRRLLTRTGSQKA